MPPPVGSVGLDPRLSRATELVPLIRATDVARVTRTGQVVVEFMNFGCPYCRGAMPELDRVAEEKLGKVKFHKVSLADPAAQDMAGRLGISLLPGFAVFNNGAFVGSFGRQGSDMVTAQFIRDNVAYAFDSVGVKI